MSLLEPTPAHISAIVCVEPSGRVVGKATTTTCVAEFRDESLKTRLSSKPGARRLAAHWNELENPGAIGRGLREQTG